MASLQYSSYQGWGQFTKSMYSQVVRVGDRLEISGQGMVKQFKSVQHVTNRASRWLGDRDCFDRRHRISEKSSGRNCSGFQKCGRCVEGRGRQGMGGSVSSKLVSYNRTWPRTYANDGRGISEVDAKSSTNLDADRSSSIGSTGYEGGNWSQCLCAEMMLFTMIIHLIHDQNSYNAALSSFKFWRCRGSSGNGTFDLSPDETAPLVP